MPEVVCDECKKPITKKDDLVVRSQFHGFSFKKFHKGCYKDPYKGSAVFSIGSFLYGYGRPVNSKETTIRRIAASMALVILGLFILSIAKTFAMTLFAVLVIILSPLILLTKRAYVYLKYERPLD